MSVSSSSAIRAARARELWPRSVPESGAVEEALRSRVVARDRIGPVHNVAGVLRCAPRHRLPEPCRMAHALASHRSVSSQSRERDR